MTRIPSPTDRRSVVFGGRGFLGSHLVDALARAGACVLSFDLKPPTDPVPDHVEVATGDIGDPVAVARSVRGADHVFSFAGGIGPRVSFGDPLADLNSSCVPQLVLLEAILRNAPSASVGFPGSRPEYGKPDYLPVDEKHVLKGDSPYAIHKSACGAYYRMYYERYGVHTVVLRLPQPYGSHVIGDPERHMYGILNIFVDRALAGEKIVLYGDGSQLRDFLHVDDMVSAALIASISPQAAGEVFNIGSGEPHSLAEAAEHVVASARRGVVESGAEWPPDAAAIETGDVYFDTSKARQVLGWMPSIPFADGVSRLVLESMRMSNAQAAPGDNRDG